MFNSILDKPAPTQFRENVPKSDLPWVWFGFIFAFAFLVAEFVTLMPDLEQETFNLVFIVIMLAGWIYWLFCVHRFHKILREMSHKSYPILPNEAVLRHFIPFYNLVWMFRWPAAFSGYINDRGRVRMVSGNLIGLLLLASFILRFVDGAIALAVIFAAGLYLSAKLRRHIELLKAESPEMLPPLPDKNLFGYLPGQEQGK